METRAADTHGTNPPVDFARTDPTDAVKTTTTKLYHTFWRMYLSLSRENTIHTTLTIF